MRRRAYLRAFAGATGAVGLAGCLGSVETRRTGAPSVPEDRPDGIYVPSHIEGMAMVGTAETGEYGVGTTYSYPHRFWTVSGDSVSKTGSEDEDDVHLMSSVWDPETGTVVPETGLSVEVYQGEELVSQEAIYAMLSQPMGFHYGANFGLAGDGTYRIVVSVGALPIRTTGAFVGRFEEPATAEFTLEYSREQREKISYEILDERAGQRGAVDPAGMGDVPTGTAPPVEDLPGRVVGEALSDGVRFVPTVLETPPDGVDGEGEYLAVSARTRYNGMVVPAMGVRGRLTRDGATVSAGRLTRTLDPEVGYHYGTVVDGVETGDELRLSVDTQPQTARHEGYETAFGGLKGDGMAPVSLTV